MKILIVDDDREKIKKITQVIKTIYGIEDTMIEFSIIASQAKEMLTRTQYDLLILDLNMPEHIEDENDEETGSDFIDELFSVHRYKKPIEIVIISAYEQCEKDFIKKPGHIAFKLLRYDENSIVWQEQLKAIIEYRLMFSRQNNMKENVDYVFVTSVPVETEAVKRLFKEWDKIEFDDDINTYYITSFEKEGRRKKLVTVQSPDMGMVAASITTYSVCKHFSPKYVIIVGIAAGIGKHNYGDILIPREVWTYSSGKYVDREGEKELIPDPKAISLNSKIVEIIRQDHSTVLSEIQKKWTNPVHSVISICDAPMACGTAVVANKKVVEDNILAHSRKSGGIDMESYGVFYAIQSLNDEKVKAICIKSVSDFADDDKMDSYQPYAAYTSASFAFYLIKEILE